MSTICLNGSAFCINVLCDVVTTHSLNSPAPPESVTESGPRPFKRPMMRKHGKENYIQSFHYLQMTRVCTKVF